MEPCSQQKARQAGLRDRGPGLQKRGAVSQLQPPRYLHPPLELWKLTEGGRSGGADLLRRRSCGLVLHPAPGRVLEKTQGRSQRQVEEVNTITGQTKGSCGRQQVGSAAFHTLGRPADSTATPPQQALRGDGALDRANGSAEGVKQSHLQLRV